MPTERASHPLRYTRVAAAWLGAPPFSTWVNRRASATRSPCDAASSSTAGSVDRSWRAPGRDPVESVPEPDGDEPDEDDMAGVMTVARSVGGTDRDQARVTSAPSERSVAGRSS